MGFSQVDRKTEQIFRSRRPAVAVEMRVRGLRLWVALLCACCLACGDSTDWASKGPTDEKYSQVELSLGEAVYIDTCSACHGQNGSGSFGPDLVGKGHKYSYEEQRNLVLRGRRSMPGFGASLTEAEIDAVVAHIRVGFFSNSKN